MNHSVAIESVVSRRFSLAAVTRCLPAVTRVGLGLLFFVSGLNGFLNFLPAPSAPMPEGAIALGAAFMKSGYLFPLIAGTEAVAGALLLTNRLVPLALVLLAPVIVNIFAFHWFLASSGLEMAVVLLVVELYLAWVYRRVYLPMLAVRVTPRAA